MSIRRILAAGGVLAVGWIAAVPFYQRHNSQSPGAAPELLSLRDANQATGARQVAAKPAVGTAIDEVGLRLPPGAGTSTLGRPMEQGSQRDAGRLPDVHPHMAESFDQAVGGRRVDDRSRWAGWRAPVSPPVSQLVQPGARSPESARAVSPAEEPRPLRRQETAPRRHVIRDGDTLEFISERYYGSAEYAGFLYATNSGILPAADLLPIGAVLNIPPSPRRVELPVDASSQTTAATDSDDLVPVRWSP